MKSAYIIKSDTKEGVRPQKNDDNHLQMQEHTKSVKRDQEKEKPEQYGGDSPYGVGDKGAGGRKLMASFFNLLLKTSEDKPQETRVEMRQEDEMVSDKSLFHFWCLQPNTSRVSCNEIIVGLQNEDGLLPYRCTEALCKPFHLQISTNLSGK